jgi:hypothetical protein
MPFVGIGVGIGRQRFAQGGIFAAYAARVAADGGVTEGGSCVNAVSGISLNSSLLLVPSGYKSGVVYSQIPTDGDGDLTFTRASEATRVNSDGEIEVVGSGVPRLDYSQGSCPALLLEPQRTNSVRNSTMQGAVTGNPGTLPTNWSFGLPTGFNREIVGVGTENGLSYVDVRYYGTPTGGSFLGISPDSNTQISAISGQTWSYSVYVKLVSGTIPTNSSTFQATEYNSAGVFLATSSNSYNLNTLTSLTRLVNTRTLNEATCAFTNWVLRTNYTTGVAYDFTIRFAQPQIEQGAYVTTPIFTSGATVTRLQDGQKVENIADLIGQTEGTIFIDVYFQELSQVGFRVFFSLEGAVSSQFSGLNASTTNNGNNINYAGGTYALTTGRHKIVCTYSEANNERKLYVDGALRSTSTHTNFLASISQLSIGCRINPFSSFGTDRVLDTGSGINAFAMYPTLLSNDDCLTLSTL